MRGSPDPAPDPTPGLPELRERFGQVNRWGRETPAEPGAPVEQRGVGIDQESLSARGKGPYGRIGALGRIFMGSGPAGAGDPRQARMKDNPELVLAVHCGRVSMRVVVSQSMVCGGTPES